MILFTFTALSHCHNQHDSLFIHIALPSAVSDPFQRAKELGLYQYPFTNLLAENNLKTVERYGRLTNPKMKRTQEGVPVYTKEYREQKVFVLLTPVAANPNVCDCKMEI